LEIQAVWIVQLKIFHPEAITQVLFFSQAVF